MSIEDKHLDNGVQIRKFTPPDVGDASRWLVLIHGLGTDVDNWGEFPAALDRPVMALDVPRAEKLGSFPTMRACAKLAIESVAKEIGDEPFDLLGYSWGGLLAEQMALDFRPQVARLVLAATIPGMMLWPPHPAAMRLIYSGNRSDEVLEKVAAAAYGGKVRDDWRLASEIGLGTRDTEATRKRQVAAARWTGNNLMRLHFLETPTLIITGDDDPFVSQRHAKFMESIIPNAERRVIRGEGHLVLLTSSVESAAVINPFLGRTSA